MKKIFSFLFVVFFCVVLVSPALAEENKKADFGFSLSGGNTSRDKGFSWMGEFYLAQDWRLGREGSKMHNLAFLVQGSGMAYVYDTENPWENGEYGASAGLGPEYYFSDSVKLGAFIFTDVLGKNRFYFAHIRPTFLISSRRLKVLGGVAFNLTKPVLVSETIAGPIFWYDYRGYGYDMVYQRLVAETIDYAFIRGEFVLKPSKWLDLDFAGEYNQGIDQYKNIKRTELGVKAGFFKGLIALGIQYFKTQAENVWSRWFDQNGWRFEISFNPFTSKKSFSDLVQRKFVDIFWPVVVVKEDNNTVPTKISETLKYVLLVEPEEYCINEKVKFIGEIKSGTPSFNVRFDFGDGTVSEFQTSDKKFFVYHAYTKAGEYCISSSVEDQWGHKVEQCECVEVKDCSTPCVSAEVVQFKADKYAIKKGESVNLTGKAENATILILNGGEFNNKVEPNPFTQIATPSKTTTYELKASNDCPSEDTAHLTILVDECKEIVLKNSDFQVSPLSVKVNEKVTVIVAMAENATGLIATKDGVSFAIEPAVYEFSFSEAGTHEFRVVYKNDCSTAEASKTVNVTKSCVMCNEQNGVTFHADGSFALDKNNFPEGQNIEFDFQLYNKSDCAFTVPLKYNARYQDGGQEVFAAGSTDIGSIPAHTVWNMKFFFKWSTKTVTISFVSSGPLSSFEQIGQCPNRKVKVKLSIGNCGPL
ncbi:MAG: hypothetical protein ABH919_03540 [bacterium]